MVKVYALPADEGDFLWISYGKNEHYAHILVDGGTKDSGDDYAEIIERIDRRGEKIEALVLTHVDYDHIQGAINGICRISSTILKRVVKRIFFNTCRGIRRELSKNEKHAENYAEDQIYTNLCSSQYGIGDGITFLKLLSEKGLRDCLNDYIVYGQQIVLEKAVVNFISPGEKELIEFADKWEEYKVRTENLQYAGNMDMVKQNLEDLMKEKLLSDSSINNASSIAFIFVYENVKLVFLGDAKPAVCLKGLKKFKYPGEIEVDLMKLSHHGSRSNTSDSLLKIVKTQNYLLSTNGHNKKVPSKVMIAHLLKNAKEKNVNLYCNYDWYETEYHNKYFTKEDYEKFLDNNKLTLYLLNDKGTEIKDGCSLYGEYEMFGKD